MSLVHWQVGFGRRYPGSREHKLFRAALCECLESKVNLFHCQDFQVSLQGKQAACANLIGVFKAGGTPERGPLLLGTHFDTRKLADNEEDPSKRNEPILGANDGGSGTAILLHLLNILGRMKFNRDILIVLFDAEDVGNIESNRFSMGARYYARHEAPPEEVLILDMVGGRNMMMNVDAHILHHEGSRRLTEQIFSLASLKQYKPFIHHQKDKTRYIICDHIPFLTNGIPSCVLIDIDYPEWHTQRDLPAAMSADSLVMIEDLVLAFLSQFIVPRTTGATVKEQQ